VKEIENQGEETDGKEQDTGRAGRAKEKSREHARKVRGKYIKGKSRESKEKRKNERKVKRKGKIQGK